MKEEILDFLRSVTGSEVGRKKNSCGILMLPLTRDEVMLLAAYLRPTAPGACHTGLWHHIMRKLAGLEKKAEKM